LDGIYGLTRPSARITMLLGTAFLFTPVPLMLAAVAVFAVGTEIRVRIEDA